MPASTSIENYREHRRSGKLGAQAQVILDFLAENPGKNWSRSELELATGIRLSSVCGRVNELLKAELITERPERLCSITKKTIRPVRIKRSEH